VLENTKGLVYFDRPGVGVQHVRGNLEHVTTIARQAPVSMYASIALINVFHFDTSI
jgi:hypothetical protein